MPGSNYPGGGYPGLDGFLSLAATVTVSGVEATSAVGTVVATGAATGTVMGVVATAAAGTAVATGVVTAGAGWSRPSAIYRRPLSLSDTAVVRGVSACAQAGKAIAAGGSRVEVVGVSARAGVGLALAYGIRTLMYEQIVTLAEAA